MTDVEFCYFSALIDGLRLIDGKAREKNIVLEDVDVTALAHYVHSVGDKLVDALIPGENLDLRVPEARPSRPSKHTSRGFVEPAPEQLLPYSRPRKMCKTEGCNSYHLAKGLCRHCYFHTKTKRYRIEMASI